MLRKKFSCVLLSINNYRVFSTCHNPCLSPSKADYIRCYRVLGLKEDCDEEQLRMSFLTLAKKFHPDSGTETADAAKFQEIEAAYRQLQEKFTQERHKAAESEGEYGLYHKDKVPLSEEEEEDESASKHVAPQHRQFLSFDGFGYGNPFQREKQYQKQRAMKAAENVYGHRIEKLHAVQDEHSLMVKDIKAAKKIKTQFAMDRLVEDLIQESMAKGEFSNLKGSGKPLKNQNHNPYIDTVTHKINQVLIDNGFSPRWVMLEKEIRQEIDDLRQHLKEERSFLGRHPLDPADLQCWNTVLEQQRDKIRDINKKINDYNLVVPSLHKQMIQVNLNKLGDKILMNEPSKEEVPTGQRKTARNLQPPPSSSPTLLDLITNIWR